MAGIKCLISRTGYTGEDGFELYCAAGDTERLWNAVLAAGKPQGLVPTGLGCRNTLRLECKMALYGHEIDDTIHALEAGLGWIVKLDKGDFIGRQALLAAKGAPAPRKLVGFKTLEKRDIARDHMPVVQDGKQIGFVTSGRPRPPAGSTWAWPTSPLSWPRSAAASRSRSAAAPWTRKSSLRPFTSGRSNFPSLSADRHPILTDLPGGSMFPADLKYTKDHEWLKPAGRRHGPGGHHPICAGCPGRRGLRGPAGGWRRLRRRRGIRHCGIREDGFRV